MTDKPELTQPEKSKCLHCDKRLTIESGVLCLDCEEKEWARLEAESGAKP